MMSASNQASKTPSEKSGSFPQTLWTMVLEAGGSSSAQSAEALARLCQIYWYPIYVYLRRHGTSSHDAEDLTQAFLARLCDKQRLGNLTRDKGKFRSYLLVALKHFVADEAAKASAKKRGGGETVISLDALEAEDRYAQEPADLMDPERAFERQWALTVLENTNRCIAEEFAASGKQERFEQLQPYLLGDPADKTFADAAARFGMSEGGLKMAVSRLRLMALRLA